MLYSALYLKKSRSLLMVLGVASCITLLIGTFVFIKQLSGKNGWQKVKGLDKVYVVNRSSHGFQVIWTTSDSKKEDQWVEVGSEKGTYPIMGNSSQNENVYSAAVTGLESNKTYYFRIRMGDKTFILPSLAPESVTTPKEVREKPISPAYGKVVLPSTKPYANGLLIYEIDGYYPLAVFTKETGEWLLPLTGLIERKSNTITSVRETNPVSIKLFSYPKGSIRTVVGQTRPLKQTIVAGTTSQLAQTLQGKNESVLGTYSQSSQAKSASTTSITYPKENALIPGNSPLIRGTAQIGSDVTVSIKTPSKQFSYRTKTDEKGDWLVQSPLALGAGRYTITVTVISGEGLPTILIRSFNIIKSGEQVLGDATGSSVLVPTTRPVPTYTTTTTSSAVLTPTPIPSRTPILPTSIIPTRLMPTATPPVTGGGISGFLFGAIFCIVIGTGLVLAF